MPRHGSEFDRVKELLAEEGHRARAGGERESAYLQSEGHARSREGRRAQRGDRVRAHRPSKAPISGRISRAITTTGNFVTAGTTLLTTIVTVDPVYVYTDIDENSLLKLQALQARQEAFIHQKGRMSPVEVQLSNENRISRTTATSNPSTTASTPAPAAWSSAVEFSNTDGSSRRASLPASVCP
jgi:multidrug efflux pump subunit AcrA (membrane-fusion protein)